jgi:multiple sugar transport system permease protein
VEANPSTTTSLSLAEGRTHVRVKGSRRVEWSLSKIARYFAIAVLVCYALIPFYWMVISAVRPTAEMFAVPPSWIPSSVSLHNFVAVWTQVPLARFMLNSAIVAGVTVLVAVTISGLAGYGLSRFDFRGNGLVTAIVLFTQTIPGVIILIPFYVELEHLGLLNSRVGLALSYTVWAIPFCTLLLRSYFKTAYSRDIEEAAIIDGCTGFSLLWRIVLPLSLPGLLAAATFTFLLAWNEFIWASLVLSSGSARPVSVGLEQFVGQFGQDQDIGLYMAAAVYSTLPPLLLFLAVQRYALTGYGALGQREK